MDELTARPAKTSEAAQVARLVNAAYGRTNDPTGWTNEGHLIEGPRVTTDEMRAIIKDPEHEMIIAEGNGELIACAHVEPLQGGACEIGMLSLKAKHQGQGVGRWILRQAEDHAHEAGATRTILHVLTAREELFPWYERRGYEPTGQTQPLELGDAQQSRVGPLMFKVLEKNLA